MGKRTKSSNSLGISLGCCFIESLPQRRVMKPHLSVTMKEWAICLFPVPPCMQSLSDSLVVSHWDRKYRPLDKAGNIPRSLLPWSPDRESGAREKAELCVCWRLVSQAPSWKLCRGHWIPPSPPDFRPKEGAEACCGGPQPKTSSINLYRNKSALASNKLSGGHHYPQFSAKTKA